MQRCQIVSCTAKLARGGEAVEYWASEMFQTSGLAGQLNGRLTGGHGQDCLGPAAQFLNVHC